ncbi:hypothetical protein FKM82_027257 [Ascaphus truei]
MGLFWARCTKVFCSPRALYAPVCDVEVSTGGITRCTYYNWEYKVLCPCGLIWQKNLHEMDGVCKQASCDAIERRRNGPDEVKHSADTSLPKQITAIPSDPQV